MKIGLWSIGAMLGTVMLTPAQAQSERFYVIGGFGMASADYDAATLESDLSSTNTTVTVKDIDDTRLSWNLGLGYLMFEHWMLELSYIDLGDTDFNMSVTTSDLDQFSQTFHAFAPESPDGVALSVGYQFALNNDWYLGISAGLYGWESKSRTYVNGVDWIEIRQSGTDPRYGALLSYQASPDLLLSVGYDRFNLAQSDVDRLQFDMRFKVF